VMGGGAMAVVVALVAIRAAARAKLPPAMERIASAGLQQRTRHEATLSPRYTLAIPSPEAATFRCC
ncbi:methylcrotonoyl-CoA carboxylase, partial [Pseudomonas sp. S37]|nr:methylcrotonoyl-CoA carboxylase [Pseudomonas sp. S37]